MSAFATIVALGCLIGGSWLIGRALLVVADARELSGLEVSLGLALLLCVSVLGVRFPGHGTTAAVLLVLLAAAAAWFARRDLASPDRGLLIAAAIVAVAVLIPFAAQGRFGILGVGKLDDIAAHYALADSLRIGYDLNLTGTLNSYPMAPHALVAAIVRLLHTDDPAAFTALMMTTAIGTALAAATAFTRGPALLRGVAAAVAGFAFLPAAYYGQSAFKDLLVGLFVLTFAVALERLAAARAFRHGPVALLGLPAAAALGTFGSPGPAWLVGTAGLWPVAVAIGTRWRPNVGDVRRVVSLGAGAVAVTVLATLPQIDRIVTFNAAQNAVGGSDPKEFLGNLYGYLPLSQALGVWPSGDFRVDPTVLGTTTINLLALAIGAGLVVAVISDARRRRFALASALVAAMVIYLVNRRTQGPYVTAKTMVIMAPLVGTVLLRWLLSARAGTLRIAGYGAAVAVAVLLGWNSSLALRTSAVGSLYPALDLRTFQSTLKDREVLFIGFDNFAAWELVGTRLAMVSPYSVNPSFPVELRPGKPVNGLTPVDPDAVTPSTLARTTLVLTSNSGYGSQLAGKWTPIQRSSLYTLWKRKGPVPDKQILDEGGLPGVKLTCRRGVPSIGADARALVRTEPVGRAGTSWTGLDGTPLPVNPDSGFTIVPAGATVRQTITLAAGEWDLALQYAGTRDIRFDTTGLGRTLPSNQEAYGAAWGVGTVRSPGGPTTVYVTVGDKPLLSRPTSVSIGTVIATPRSDDQTLKANAACGRYLDGYLTG